MSKQDEPNHLLQNTNGKLAFSNPFASSPRASPGLSEQRTYDLNAGYGSPSSNDGTGPSQGTRFNAPVFRPSFSEDIQGPIHRALDPIAPDQREPGVLPLTNDSAGASASFRMAEGERPYPHLEAHASSRERSMTGHFVDNTDDGSGLNMNQNPLPPSGGIFRQASLGGGISPFAIQRQNSFSNSLTPRHSVSQDNVQLNNSNYVSSALSGPPVTVNTSSTQQPPIIHDHVLASSPVSSTSAPSASSAFIGGLNGDKTFDSQIKTSPFLHDILDRVIRTEYAQRDLAREVGALTNKINFLVERLEHADPRRSFSASPIPGMGNHNMNVSPLAGGGIHQNNLGGGGGDGDISKRLDALTNSVQQILMIQQHGHNNVNNNGPHQNHSSFHGNGPLSPGGGGPGPGGFDNMPGPNIPLNGPGGIMGPNRPHSRNPPPPVRTWSAGSLDMPLRQEVHLSRPDALLNQKRRSVVGNLVRRDSAATIDSDWGGGSPRDSGPTITKWEHLQLVPDLLRSISKYGVGPPNKIQQRALPFLLNGADIIAQAPPTQERIAAYVIPAIHIALTSLAVKPQNRGPIVLIISTTVDQATQAQRMIRDLGGAIGVRSALGVGTGGDVQQEIRLLQQSVPHILCGTPQKLHSLLTVPNGLPSNEIRFLVLDEVDQLIARNLHEFVFNIVKLLPSSRPVPPTGAPGPGAPGPGTPTPTASPNPSSFSPFGSPGDSSGSPPNAGNGSGFASSTRRFPPLVHSTNPNDSPGAQAAVIKRQTALFSNTVPQDVLNLANSIQLRDPVRVLVRRDGNVTSSEAQKGGPGSGLKQFYLYLAFTAAGGRLDNNGASGAGLGIIGSGRTNQNAAETAQAKEWKLDALSDLFDDVEIGQTIVHVGSLATLDAVVYKLASRGLEAIPLHTEMNSGAKMAAFHKFRGNNSIMMKQQPVSRVLVVFDVQIKSSDVFQVPLVINYDLPKIVEEYSHRVSPAISTNYSRPGVVVNFVTATGGDVEMLRSIECFYKIKCPEVPISLRDVL